jgi:protein SCO1
MRAGGHSRIFYLEVVVQRRTLWIGIVTIGILVVITAVVFLAKKHTMLGAVIDPPAPASEINLTDSNGNPFALSALRGKVVLLYFGYTNCPDECPLTMAHLKLAFDTLGAKSKDVQVVMVTTDPQRDSQQALKDFMAKFNPAFLGLFGTPAELQKVWQDYGVTVENNGETHSTFLYVIDQAGNIRETFQPDTQPDSIAADVSFLLTGK